MTPPPRRLPAAGTRLVVFTPLPPRRDRPMAALEADYDCVYVVASEIEASASGDTREILTNDQYWRERPRFLDCRHLFHIANDARHRHCLVAAMRHPGVIALHDLALGRLFDAVGDRDHPIREFSTAGQCLAHQREVYGWHSREASHTPPLYQQLVARSQAVIVHTAEAELRIRAVRGAPPVIRAAESADGLDAYRAAIELAHASPKRAWTVDGDWEFAPPHADPSDSSNPPGQLWRTAAMAPINHGRRRVIGVLGPSDDAPGRFESAFRDDDIRPIQLNDGGQEFSRDFDLVFMNGDMDAPRQPLSADLRLANRRHLLGGLLIADLWTARHGLDGMPLGRRALGRLFLECGYALEAYVERSFTVEEDHGLECCVRAVKISEFDATPVHLPRWDAPIRSGS